MILLRQEGKDLLLGHSHGVVIGAVRCPLRQKGAGYAFHEMARRKGDLAICAVAAKVTDRAVRLGVGGIADKPTVRDWNDLADAGLDDALNEDAHRLCQREAEGGAPIAAVELAWLQGERDISRYAFFCVISDVP